MNQSTLTLLDRKLCQSMSNTLELVKNMLLNRGWEGLWEAAGEDETSTS